MLYATYFMTLISLNMSLSAIFCASMLITLMAAFSSRKYPRYTVPNAPLPSMAPSSYEKSSLEHVRAAPLCDIGGESGDVPA